MLKALLTAALMSLLNLCPGQQWHDPFDLGFPSSPVHWYGDTGEYRVNSSGQLQLDRTGAGTSTLTTPVPFHKEMRWACYVKMSFNTSANNYGELLLWTDSTGHRTTLRLGGADDRLSLLRRDAAGDSVLSTGAGLTTSAGVNAFWVEILLSKGLLVVRSSPDSLSWNYECAATVTLVPDSSHTGLSCTVTSSNSTKVRFDDFLFAHTFPDTIGPQVSGWEFPERDRIRLHFNEAIDTAKVLAGSMSCHAIPPIFLGWFSPNALTMYFDTLLPSRAYLVLQTGSLCDTSGNCTPDTSISVFYLDPGYGDVLISEVLPDPTPPVGLPPVEYLELHNTTGFPLDLDGWQLSVDGNTSALTQVILPPDSYLVVIDEDDLPIWPPGALITSVFSLSLPNEGMELALRTGQGILLHAFRCESRLWSEDWKSAGGWSLERSDMENMEEAGNWQASKDLNGGTPGIRNSSPGHLADSMAPAIRMVIPVSPFTIRLCFNSPVDSSSVPGPSAISIRTPIIPTALTWAEPFHDELQVELGQPLLPGRIYSIEGPPLADLNGNLSTSGWNALVAWPEEPDSADVVLNEVLYDALPFEQEFIEIYNRSLRVVSLRHLALALYDTLTGLASDAVFLFPEHRLLFPGEYCYVSRDMTSQARVYGAPAERGLDLPGMFSLDDDGAILCLLRGDGDILDVLAVDPGLQHPVAGDGEGRSLERVHPDISSESPGSWQTSAFTGPGATPGWQNTMWDALPSACISGEWTMNRKVITPDLDGVDDFLLLSWQDVPQTAIADIGVLDLSGRPVRTLASSLLCGPHGSMVWDGKDDGQNLLPEGFYVIRICTRTEEGRWLHRFPVAITYR